MPESQLNWLNLPVPHISTFLTFKNIVTSKTQLALNLSDVFWKYTLVLVVKVVVLLDVL